jgi:hypothetical protein
VRFEVLTALTVKNTILGCNAVQSGRKIKVPEKNIVSIIWAYLPLAFSAYSSSLNMEVVRSSETSVIFY